MQLFSLFLEHFQSVLQELNVLSDVLVISIRRANRFSVSIKQDIKRLGIGSEFASLQITPFVADGFQFARFPRFPRL